MPPPSHWFVFIALHEPMDVQFHCVIEKASVEEEKRGFPIPRLRCSRSEISIFEETTHDMLSTLVYTYSDKF